MKERIEIREGSWAELGDVAGEIRRIVFIEEQQVPREEEWDGRDDECRHFLALHDASPLGTARLLPDGHIGRVAVLREARGLGIGAALMQAAIASARRLGHPRSNWPPRLTPSPSMKTSASQPMAKFSSTPAYRTATCAFP